MDDEAMDEAAPVADSRLLLLAQEADVLPLISALVQDAIVHPAEIAYDRRARRLVLLLDRYRWEAGDRTRVRSALRIESVTRVQRRGWSAAGPHDPDIAVLDLLAFLIEGDILTIAFAAGPTLRIETECVDIILEDISPPWLAGSEPMHE
ncbi:DUF2948 family protein [Glacieibacterium megasporae]|uniref:DUF2948 family protein n=1 Tax=Glacieibacterium megasporae TaxID=2835787 RepID=UPI001C1E0236|nr:DUF2948 family protein [Polymorphobacter megasporae]UAJ11258.1 DUF2948 family protein [Polymorphobacter megasporae]